MTKVFFALIKSEIGVAERNFSMNGFRMRITEVRQELASEGIHLHHRLKKFKNEFGHEGCYRQHYIEKKDKRAAREIYKKVLQKTA